MNDYPEGSWGYEAERLLAKVDALPWYLWPFKWHIRHSIATARKRNRKALTGLLKVID